MYWLGLEGNALDYRIDPLIIVTGASVALSL